MQTTTLEPKRFQSIDLLRGLVMVIMALDHTRDFFHREAFTGSPLDPATTTPVLYFTRWITHFCAPLFVFLSGLSAWLQSSRKTTKELSRFLITRGLWLVFLEFTVMTFGLIGDIRFGLFTLQTIWSIGISMIILGLMIWLPFKAILITGLVIVLGHNAMDFAEKAWNGNVPLWWSFLHRTRVVPLGGGFSIGIFYPFLSWAGLMMLGYCAGKLFTDMDAVRRKRILISTGIGALLLFLILRAINIYGDPLTWSKQDGTMRTFFSFMNVQKYPPSLLFMCATIGPALLFLSTIKDTNSRISKIIMVYGRVPLFYFVVHFYLLHIATAVFFLSRGHTLAEGINGLPRFPFRFVMPGEGFSLGGVYIAWLITVIIMYPLCKWFDQYKRNHKDKWWLSYL